jgi:hypothetical protein
MRRRTLTAVLILGFGAAAADDRDSDMLDAVVLDGDTAALAGAVAAAVSVTRGGMLEEIREKWESTNCNEGQLRKRKATDNQRRKNYVWLEL